MKFAFKMNVNEPFSESELLGMSIDVNNIFDFVGNVFRGPYVLASKLVRSHHIFNVRFKHSPNNTEKFAFSQEYLEATEAACAA